jgi:hypothetical protein
MLFIDVELRFRIGLAPMLCLSIYSAGCGDGAHDMYCDEDERWRRVAKRLNIQVAGSIDSSGAH